jgi:hypothetical protein
MRETLLDAKGDDRIPTPLLMKMQATWETGLAYACKG